jgi:hypothetical protein
LITHQFEQPSEESEPIASPETEPTGPGSEGLGEGGGMVVGVSNGVGHDAGHGLRVLMVCEKVGRDARGSRNQKAPELDALVAVQWSSMDPDVGTARLAPCRQRELMGVGRQVTETVQRGSGSV